MHITLDTKTLAGAISLLSGMQSKNMATTVPVLGHVLLSHDGAGEVTLSVTDMDLRGRVTLHNQQLHLEAGRPDAIAVKIPVFAAQCKAASEATEVITLKTTDNLRLTLKAKRFSASIVGINPKEFPSQDFTPPEAELVIAAADLHRLLRAVAPSIDTAQYDFQALSGVNLTAADMLVRAAATDKVRMTACTVAVAERRENILSLFLPKALVQHGLSMLSRLDGEGLVSVGRSRLSNSIFLWQDGVVLASRELAVKFPDLTVWFSMAVDSRRIVVSIPDLERVLNAALPFSIEERSETPKIYLHYADGMLRVTCQNQATGEFEAELEAQAEGITGPVDFAVNAALLRSFVSSMKTADDRMAIVPSADKRSAIQFVPANDTEGRLRGWCAPMI